MQIVQEFRLSYPISTIYKDDECLSIVTNNIAIHHYSKENKLVYDHPFEKTTKEIHAYANSVSISKKGTLVLPTCTNEHVKLYTANGSLHEIKFAPSQDEEIEASLFSTNNKLLVLGNKAGRCNIYNGNDLSPIFELKPRPDYINALALSPTNRYLLSSAYNKSVRVFDISRARNKTAYVTKSVIVNSLFLNNHQVLSILQDGAVNIYDIQAGEKVFEENLLPHWPSAVMQYNEKYILITTRSNAIYFFNVQTFEIDFELKLSYKGVTSVHKYEGLLYVGYHNGTVQVIDTNHHLNGFEVALKVDNIVEAKAYVQKNSFLQAHPKYSDFQGDKFGEDLQVALNKLGQDLKNQALEHMKEYILDESYTEFENFLKYSVEIYKFYELIKERELSAAYIMVHDFPLLKKTPAYARLEVIWTNIFNRAKKLLQEDPIGMYKTAQNLVAPFSKVPEKKYLVGHLFNNVDIFSKADKAVKEQNFEQYFAYVKEFSFLEETSLYTKIAKFGENLIDQMLKQESLNRFDKVLDLAASLSAFPMFEKEVQEVLQRVSIKKEFDSCIMQKKYDKAFKMIDEYEFIQTLPKALGLEAKFQKDIEHAQGDEITPKMVLEQLKTYSSFSACKERIASVLKYAYINEMYAYAKHDIIYWEKVFHRFLAIYGEDLSLKKFAKISGRQSNYAKALESINYVGVKNSKLLPTLLVKKAS